jgi:hypothetical protein
MKYEVTHRRIVQNIKQALRSFEGCLLTPHTQYAMKSVIEQKLRFLIEDGQIPAIPEPFPFDVTVKHNDMVDVNLGKIMEIYRNLDKPH